MNTYVLFSHATIILCRSEFTLFIILSLISRHIVGIRVNETVLQINYPSSSSPANRRLPERSSSRATVHHTFGSPYFSGLTTRGQPTTPRLAIATTTPRLLIATTAVTVTAVCFFSNHVGPSLSLYSRSSHRRIRMHADLPQARPSPFQPYHFTPTSH